MEQINLSNITNLNLEKSKKSVQNPDNSLFALLFQNMTMVNIDQSTENTGLATNLNIDKNTISQLSSLNSNFLQLQSLMGFSESTNTETIEDISLITKDVNTELENTANLELISEIVGSLIQLANNNQVSDVNITNIINTFSPKQQNVLINIMENIVKEQQNNETETVDISKVTKDSINDVIKINVVQLKELNEKIQTLLHNTNNIEETTKPNSFKQIDKVEELIPNSSINQTFAEKNLTSKQEIITNPQPKLEHLNQNKDFTSELGKILIRNVKLPDGVSQTNIQLHPEELGQINVKLTAHQGTITAQLVADTVVGKELLENQLHQLRQNLVQQGYQVEKIDVQVASTSSSNTDLKNGFQFSQQQSQQQQNPQQQNRQRKNSYHLNGYSDENEGFMGVAAQLEGIDYTV